MKMLTVKEVWSKELYKSSRIEWLLIFIELAWRNIRSITKLKLLGLLVYQVGTWLIEEESLRLKESATSMKMPLYTE